jgi:hypothetical protein
MRETLSIGRPDRLASVVAISVLSGALLGISGGIGGHGLAQNAPPKEHKGLSVESLGLVPAESMSAQVGLTAILCCCGGSPLNPAGKSPNTVPNQPRA